MVPPSLGVFAKLQKVGINFVMPVCPFIHISYNVVYCQDFWSSTVSASWTGHTVYEPEYNFFTPCHCFSQKRV